MKHTEIILEIIEKNGYQSYLEIGCQGDVTFDKVKVLAKIGVDPVSGGTLRMTSDEFFATNEAKFDCIFIDGDHRSEQVYKDIKNAIKILSKGGTIIVHDLLPENKEMQLVPRITKAWTGDGWKSWLKVKTERADLKMFVVDTDFGVGIITRGRQTKLKIDPKMEEFDFIFSSANRKKYMETKTVEEFKDWLNESNTVHV